MINDRVVQKFQIYFCMIERQKIMRQPKNEIDRPKITVSRHIFIQDKSTNAILKISAILENFLWHVVLQICFFRIWKKLNLGWERPIWKKSRFFLKNDVIFEKSAILNFWKKFFLQKLDNKKTLQMQSRFMKSVKN
jgi:hypothetical protein